MNKYGKTVTVLVAAAFVLAIAGCNTERAEQGKDRAILKAGQQVSEDMVGWVAVPNNTPKLVQDKDKNVAYAVLASHQYVPDTMNGWQAMPAVLFAKMADIKVDAPKEGAVEKWVLKPLGKSVPKDKTGWVAVPYSEPKIESRKKGLEMAALSVNDIVPKDLNGWVAVDSETLAKLVEKYVATKGAGAELPKQRTENK